MEKQTGKQFEGLLSELAIPVVQELEKQEGMEVGKEMVELAQTEQRTHLSALGIKFQATGYDGREKGLEPQAPTKFSRMRDILPAEAEQDGTVQTPCICLPRYPNYDHNSEVTRTTFRSFFL